MQKRLKILGGAVALIAVCGGLCWWFATRPQRPPVVLQNLRSKAAIAAEKERKEGDKIYASHDWSEAQNFYTKFVQRHAQSSDPEVQDEVGAARMRLGYVAAKTEGFDKAAVVFKDAVANYKGTGKMNSDFGGPEDQAAYQAIVCLEAAGKKDEARKEYVLFLKDRPKSPLIYGVHKRLVRLNGGKTTDEYDKLLQEAIEKQEKWIKIEISTCGPKCLEYLLKATGKKPPSYTELAKLCGTDDKGTTLQGMRNGMKACGFPVNGFVVNRKDFTTLPTPAIWLIVDHYVVLVKVEGKYAVVYDPVTKSEQVRELPPLDDADFYANVLTFQTPRMREKS